MTEKLLNFESFNTHLGHRALGIVCLQETSNTQHTF